MPRPLLILLIITFALTLAWIFLRWFEQSNLYYPDKEVLYLPSHVRMPYEDVTFEAPDGTKLNGWYLPATPGKTTLLFCHGNGGNISNRIPKLQRLTGLGVNVFIFDYAGYGRSEGRPSEQATYRDTLAAYAYLTEKRGVNPENIVVYGESLGTAMAVELATQKTLRGMVLESPFTSTIAMGEIMLPWLPVRWIAKYRHDSLSKVPRLNIPLLVMHSPTDEVIPFAMGRALYEAAGGEKIFVELTGGHNDGYELSDADYRGALEKFLKRS